jgi:hypothetical protein
MNIQKLVGKTIASIDLVGCKSDALFIVGQRCDGMSTLEVVFTDGSYAEIKGSYEEYTGESCDEYPEALRINVYDIEDVDGRA